MKNTIIALVIAVVAPVLIGAFLIIGLSIVDIQAIIGSGTITSDLMSLGASLFAVLSFPYTSAIAGIYTPVVTIGIGGFVAGLVSKNIGKMFVVSIITIVLFFAGFYVLTFGGDPTNVNVLLSIAQNMAIDIGVGFAALFVPGAIGAKMTADDY